MKLRLVGKRAVYDMLAMLMCIVTLAFHDVTYIVVPLQLTFFLWTFSKYCKDAKILVPNGVKAYLVRYFLFIVCCLSSIIWSINDVTWLAINLSVIQCVMVSVAIVYYEQRAGAVKNVLAAIMIAAVVLCVRLMISVPRSAWGTERVGQYIGYGNVGVDYVLATASVIAFFQAYKKKSLLFSVITFLCVAVSALTGAKKGILIFAIGAAVVLIKASRNPLKMIRNILFVILGTVGVWYAIMYIDVLYQAVGSRFVSAIGQLVGTTLDKSTRDRNLLMQWGMETFWEHPIVGVGIDAFKYADINQIHYYAHNNYIELLADLGIIGALVYYFPLFKDTIKYSKVKYKNLSLELLGLAMLVSLLFSDFASVSYAHETLQLYLAVVMGIFAQKGRVKVETF